MPNAIRLLATLADPTRAAILDRLRTGPASVSDLVALLPISQPAVSQQLARLREDGLVTAKVQGARRIYQIDPAGFGPLRAWLSRFWETNLDAFRQAAEDDASQAASRGPVQPPACPVPPPEKRQDP
ncbi:ArsR/SmtB family transcription factor [Neotabrizicola shimadae]|uniref:Winged helix-turn-helix transcriptional regulator n=1 Tax=Neotabrizicola shimadae TaxID=2807096 RepID=A0A8G0ZW99_9RHOB|nr:metalloregulator ArsR/SmtB family transcription factor [Neotabrizicola shimadae]QYZ69189.1 winged helix-turn-helix transcriptional regulator [Neotabrizicola shimadae]